MMKVGLIGVGGISGVHLPAYGGREDVQLVALCDIIPERARGEGRPIPTNLGDGGGVAIKTRPYLDYRELLAAPDIDAVDICLPTYLHAEVAVAALEAGKHVLVEKPMALTVEDCDRMIAASRASGRVLMVAQVIRFWPEYLYLKSLVDDARYGAITTALFRRLGGMPKWATDCWFTDPVRSGGCILDLHLHDADYITYILGMPMSVLARGVQDAHGINEVFTEYRFVANQSIMAQGAWYTPSTFPFRADFIVAFEHAAVEWDTARGPLTVYPAEGEPFQPEMPKVNPYAEEIYYFLDCARRGEEPTVAPPFATRESVRLIHAEKESIRTGEPVTV